MTISAAAVRTELQTFFQNIASQAEGQVLNDVPFLGSLALPAGATFFGELKDQIESALVGVADDAAAIVAALNNANPDFSNLSLTGATTAAPGDTTACCRMFRGFYDAPCLSPLCGVVADYVGCALSGSFRVPHSAIGRVPARTRAGTDRPRSWRT
jgi:hypothetical protein